MSFSRSSTAPAPFTGPSWQRAALFVALALLAQVTLLHYFSLRGATFSPLVIVVVWYAIVTDIPRAAVFGLIAGFCEDMLATNSGGAWTVSTTLVAIIASLLSRNFFGDSIPLVALIVAVATLLHNLFFWMMMAAQGYPQGLGWMHFHTALWQTLLNAILVVAGMLAARLRDNLASR